MATDNESFNNDLYNLLKVRGYKPVPLNSQNQRVKASQEADVIEFSFEKDGEDFGKAWISIDDAQNIIVYYSNEQQDSPSDITPGAEYDDTWTGFLKHLKQWAQRRQLSFELSNKDRLGDDMRQRDYYKMKERLGESYHPMGKKASYNDAVPNVKIVLQHNRALEEGEARFRNVARIYLENVDGERFLAPTTRPGIARVYARHIAEGGLPNDDKWNHIKSICEDYNKMAGFVRATRNGQFNESAQQLVQEGVNHYNNLRETLHKLTTHKGYHNYFESYTPSLMEGDGEDISEMFMSSSMDPRIEAAMPILSRLQKPVNEMSEVDNLAEWADSVINEKLETEPKKEEPKDKEYRELIDFYTKKYGEKEGKKKADRIYASQKKKSADSEEDEYRPGDTKLQRYEKKAKKKLSKKSSLEEMDKEHGSRRDFDGPRGQDKTAKPVSVKQFAKGALKSLSRGLKGWEKGVHDVDTVKAATKSLSPDQKEKALGAKVGKGSPAELQQKLIKREKNKKVDEVLDTRDAKMSYAQKNMDSHKKAFDTFIKSNDPEEKAGAHKTAMKRVKGLNTFVKNKVSKDDVDENFIGMAPQAVAEAGSESNLKSFLDKYPEAEDAMYNALHHFEHAYDAMDHVAGHVLHKIPYSEWEKVRQDFIDYFAAHGLKGDVNEQVNESYPSNVKQYASDLAKEMRREKYDWEPVDLSDPEEAIDDAREQLSMFATSNMCDFFGDYDTAEQLQIIKMFNKKFGNLEEDLGPEQKRVAQLGPTEKVKNNNIGKLVGASESMNYDDEDLIAEGILDTIKSRVKSFLPKKPDAAPSEPAEPKKAPGIAGKTQQSSSLNDYIKKVAADLNAADPKTKIALVKELVGVMADRKGYPEWDNVIGSVKGILKRAGVNPNIAAAANAKLQAGQTFESAMQEAINLLLESTGLTMQILNESEDLLDIRRLAGL